ncbi:MAG: hypothetical protein ACHQAX_03995 [Gammaproteobacteria bacterium]
MFKKAVLLTIFFALLGCQSKPAQPPVDTSPKPSPHVHVEPLPELPPQSAHDDYNVALVPAAFHRNEQSDITLVLQNPNGTAAQYTDFTVNHGKRVHLIIIDPSLTDYHHLHPERTRKDSLAIYSVAFTPTMAGQYELVADVTPRQDNAQRFLTASFDVPGTAQAPHFKPLSVGAIQSEGTAATLTFQTEIDQPLRAGQATMLNITVKDSEGNLFRDLEPLMQAFAHLIGFSEDRSHVMHAHPMGREVTAENARGGPNLMFHVTFPTPGYYRLFLQVRVQDNVLTLPLDARVGP